MIQIQALRDALKNIPEKELLKIFKDFKCKKDEDVEKFLSCFSIAYEKNNICRTFFFMSDAHPGKIMGFFSVGLNVMHFNKSLKVNEAYAGMNLHENGYRPIYKLFMLGKHDEYKKDIDIKKEFKNSVISVINQAMNNVGGDLVYLDCVPELKKYYENLGFFYLDEIKEYNLIRMINRI